MSTIFAVTLGMFMSLMDSTIVIVAIPQMQKTHAGDHRRVVTPTKFLVGHAREFSYCGTPGTRGPGNDVFRAKKEKGYEKAT